MAKGVGLDIGEYEIKVVELDGSYKRPRLTKVSIDGAEAAYFRIHLSRSLRQFKSLIRGVTVRLTDLNGPRGGDSDIECRVVVDGSFPTVIVSERAPSAAAAIDVAADRVGHAVARAIGRVRTQARRFG